MGLRPPSRWHHLPGVSERTDSGDMWWGEPYKLDQVLPLESGVSFRVMSHCHSNSFFLSSLLIDLMYPLLAEVNWGYLWRLTAVSASQCRV